MQFIEPDLNILPDACICRNCRDSLSNGRKKPNNYKPRWSRVAPIIKPCEVSGCIEPACRCTKLATKEEITQNLQCPLDNLENFETNLCDNHYRNLHKQISPAVTNGSVEYALLLFVAATTKVLEHVPNPNYLLNI